MRPRRLKIEFYDPEGVRHSIAIDGPVTREKVGKLLDLVELMSGTPQASATALGLSSRKFDRLTSTIISQLRGRSFTSREARKLFETTFREKIPLSTVSTYLTRLADRGVLERQQEKRGLGYRVKLDEQKQSLAPAPSLQPS
jgi:patatin-like phospholipase/acyl hydrolase